jgi:Transposase IS116/IS110/IS902 family/Phage integrase, N-terminal SAM-like domain
MTAGQLDLVDAGMLARAGREVSASVAERVRASEAPNTVRAYRTDVTAFVKWCADNGPQAMPADAATVAAYTSHLCDRELAASTVLRAQAAIRKLVRHRTASKNRIHATLLAFGHPCPVSDLFGVGGRELLHRLELPEPWAADTVAAVHLIDQLDTEIAGCERALRQMGADHRYVPLLMTTPGVGWVLGYTIAAEIGDITRFASPTKLAGYTGLCPRV